MDLVTKHAIIIDPGGDSDKIKKILDQHDIKKIDIFHTHAHCDHFLASGELNDKFDAKLFLHKDDFFLWKSLKLQCEFLNIEYKPQPLPTGMIEHSQELTLGDQVIGQALHTPGHSPGSVCFLFSALGFLSSGDTLFQGSVGRTDLWGSDPKALERSLKDVILKLDEGLSVIPGHGPNTTLAREFRENAFLKSL